MLINVMLIKKHVLQYPVGLYFRDAELMEAVEAVRFSWKNILKESGSKSEFGNSLF